MLGLASTVSSGSILESLYSLTLDGTDDYIDTGTGINLGTGDFTISLWVKTDDFHNKFFISEYVDAEDNWYFRGSTADPPTLQFFHEISDTPTTIYLGTSISLDNHQNAWTHIAITADRNGKVTGYVNGVADTADEDGDTTNLTTTANTLIGRYHNDYSDIQIDEVSIWNVPLDEDAVTAIYNSGRPTNLTFDSGNYDNSSALVAYYKMGNGNFDDKTNGVIHDQHAPGFEADLIAANGGLVDSFSGNFTHSGGLMTVTANGNQNWNGANVEASTVYKATVDIVSGVTGKIFIGGTNSANFSGNGVNVRYVTTAASNLNFVSFNDCDDMVVRSLKVEKLKGIPGLTSGGPTFSSDTP